MARDSKRVRQLRRLKRERTNLERMLTHVLKERNAYRQILVDAKTHAVEQIVAESKEAASDTVVQVVAEPVTAPETPEAREP